MNKFHIRLTQEKSEQSKITECLGTLNPVAWLMGFEYSSHNKPHFHIHLETDVNKEFIITQLKEKNYTGRGNYSISLARTDKNPSYCIKDNDYTSFGYTAEQLSQFKENSYRKITDVQQELEEKYLKDEISFYQYKHDYIYAKVQKSGSTINSHTLGHHFQALYLKKHPEHIKHFIYTIPVTTQVQESIGSPPNAVSPTSAISDDNQFEDLFEKIFSGNYKFTNRPT